MMHTFAYWYLIVRHVLLECVPCRKSVSPFVVSSSSFLSGVKGCVSFGPGGFNLAYTGGALKSILHDFPTRFEGYVFTGVSTGSVVACCVACGMSHDTFVRLVEEFNDASRGTCFRGKQDLLPRLGEMLMRELPEDAHVICSGRLGIGVSRLKYGFELGVSSFLGLSSFLSGSVVGLLGLWFFSLPLFCVSFFLWLRTVGAEPSYRSAFVSKEDLVESILRSCSIPYVQDRCVRLDEGGVGWLDGGFSMSYLVFEKGVETVTIGIRSSTEFTVSVIPSDPLPRRIVTPPSRKELHLLLECGRKDFEACVVGLM